MGSTSNLGLRAVAASSMQSSVALAALSANDLTEGLSFIRGWGLLLSWHPVPVRLGASNLGLNFLESGADWMRDFALRYRFDHCVIHGIISFLRFSSGSSAHEIVALT